MINIQILHKEVNMIKYKLSSEELVSMALQVVAFSGQDKFPIDVIALSGGLDPAHGSHFDMIKEASEFGIVVVILNSDEWLIRKKGYCFMEFEERKHMLKSNKYIDLIIKADDDDNTVCETLRKIRPNYFGNGGDRKLNSTPETALCKELNIKMCWNIGGEIKGQSSSSLVNVAALKLKELGKI